MHWTVQLAAIHAASRHSLSLPLVALCSAAGTALLAMTVFANVASWIGRHPEEEPAETPEPDLRAGRWYRVPAVSASACTCPAPPRWLSRPEPPLEREFPFLNQLLARTVTQGDGLCAKWPPPAGPAHSLGQAGARRRVTAGLHGRPATMEDAPAWPPPAPPEYP